MGMDGFLTTHLIEPVLVPERGLVEEFLGHPDDLIDTPTPAQTLIYGPKRQRIPALWDVDSPMVSGAVTNQDAHMQATAAQRPYFFDHIPALMDQCMAEYAELTGRKYSRVDAYRCEDADYLILGMGSMTVQAAAVADWLRDERKLKVGVVNLTSFRPFPGELLGHILKGKKGVAVLERTDQPMSEDLPLMREVRATVSKCLENGSAAGAYPAYAAYSKLSDMPRLYSGCYGLGSRDLQPEGLIAAVENMIETGAHKKFFYLSIDFVRDQAANPKQEIHQQDILAAYPQVKQLALNGQSQPDAEGRHCRADALGGRLGRGYHRQESGDDTVRVARLGHQGESEIRLREEGAADDVLPLRRARTDSGQLRVFPGRCGAVTRPAGVPAHQRSGGSDQGRCVHHPEQSAGCRRAVGDLPAAYPEVSGRQ
jgi:pyruvate-ferredoxin/flavodoxin oxidoreductase